MVEHRGNPYSIGDFVVFRRLKTSNCPSRKASRTRPSQHGESYTYEIDKYWIVESMFKDGRLSLRTPKGKTVQLASDDPRLRRAPLFERWVYRHRFPRRSDARIQHSGN